MRAAPLDDRILEKCPALRSVPAHGANEEAMALKEAAAAEAKLADM